MIMLPEIKVQQVPAFKKPFFTPLPKMFLISMILLNVFRIKFLKFLTFFSGESQKNKIEQSGNIYRYTSHI